MVSVHRPSPEHLRFFDTTEVAQNPGLANAFCKPAIFAIRNIPATLWSIQLDGCVWGARDQEERENIAQKDNGASENHRYPSLIQRFNMEAMHPAALSQKMASHNPSSTLGQANNICLRFEAQSDDLATAPSPTSLPPSLSTAEYHRSVSSPRQNHPLLWKRGPRGAGQLTRPAVR